KGITFIDGHSVGNTITRVHHNTSGTTRGIQGQHSLDGYIHGWGVEGLEHDLGRERRAPKLQSFAYLCHLLSVGFGVQGSLCEQHRVLLRGYSQLVVESVVPDLLHVIPVGDNTVFNGVLQGQDTSFALGFITNIAVFLAHTHHHTL
ncbi:hypothetical protein N336_07584, partial [Phalacrocorax carbo]